MKLRARIHSVRTSGMTIRVTAYGAEVSAGEQPDMYPIEFAVRALPQAQDTFRVGRELVITIETKSR